VKIQTQQIEANVLGRTEDKNDTATLSSLVEELKARQRLLTIIQEFVLYPNLKGLSGQEKALDKFQKAYTIEPIQTSLGGSESNRSVIFKVGFSHSDRDKVFRVADKLQNLFISESLINIRSDSRGKEEFLSSQLKNSQRKLEDIEAKRQEYLKKNAGKLPETREKAISERKLLYDRLFIDNQTLEANQGRIRYLRNEYEMTVRDPSTATGTSGNPGFDLDPNANLSQLKQTLTILKARYTEQHPDVIATQNRITALEGKIKRGEIAVPNRPAGPNLGNTRESRMISREISEVEVQSTRLKSEIEGLKLQISELDKSISSIPIKESELADIERDYETQKELYAKLMIDQQQAAMQVDLIQSQRGPRFIIIDPPTKPEIPAGPPRLIIALAGIFVGLGLLFLVPVAFFYFNSSFKFKKEAEQTLSIPVIGVIPPLITPTVIAQKKKGLATSFTTSLFTLIAGIIAMFFAI